jgi:hypothetical protein
VSVRSGRVPERRGAGGRGGRLVCCLNWKAKGLNHFCRFAISCQAPQFARKIVRLFLIVETIFVNHAFIDEFTTVGVQLPDKQVPTQQLPQVNVG